MAKKIIFAAIFPLIVLILAGYSFLWFYNANQIKTGINDFLRSNSNIGVNKVKVSGFPLKYQIKAENVKLKIENQISQGSLSVKNIEAESGIFPKTFTVKLFDDVKFENYDNDNISTAKFKTPPIIKFSIANKKISHISYQDNGYQLINSDNIAIYSAGASSAMLDINDKNKEQTISIKSSFNNISNIDVFSEIYQQPEIIEAETDKNSVKEETIQQEDLAILEENTTEAGSESKLAPETEQQVTEPNSSTNNLANQDSTEQTNPENPEIAQKQEDTNEETKIANQTEEQSSKAAKVSNNNVNITIDIKLNRIQDKEDKAYKMQKANIKEFKLETSSFTFEVVGNIDYSQENKTDLIIKTKKSQNILKHLKQIISAILPPIPNKQDIATEVTENSDQSLNESTLEQTEAEDTQQNQNNDSSKEELVTTEDVAKITQDLIIPAEFIADIITEIAQQNPNSNDENFEFKILAQGNDISINEMDIIEIMTKLQPIISDIVTKLFASAITEIGKGNEIKNSDLENIEENTLPQILNEGETPEPNLEQQDDLIKSLESIDQENNNSEKPAQQKQAE